MKAASISLCLALISLGISGCDRDAAGTADPQAATAPPAGPAANASPAAPPAKGQALNAELPPAKSACPDGKGPGDKWKSDCNTCFCDENGKVACTLMACLSDDR